MIDKTLRIYGCADRPSLREELRAATNFFIDTLLPRKRILHIAVKRRKSLIDKNGTYGECWQLDEPHCFEILLDAGVSDEELITTLAHEMVHVKQFSRKELRFGHKADTWYGKKYYHEQSTSWAAYNALPWEKEATKLENKLYNAYQNHKESNKKS